MVEVKDKQSETTQKLAGSLEADKEVAAKLKENQNKTSAAVVKSLADEKKDIYRARKGLGLIKGKEQSDFPFSIRTLTSSDVNDQITKELADLFRFAFNNEYGEHIVCQPCGIQQAAWKTFGREEGAIVPLEEMDALNEFPNCPSCSQQMELNHDPEATFEKLREKFASNALISMLVDKQTEEVQGVNFAYVTTLEKAFEEEWKTPFGYTKVPNPMSFRSLDAFLEKVVPLIENEIETENGKKVEAGPDTEVFCWNCTITKPGARGKGGLQAIFQDFWGHLPEKTKNNLVLVGESQTHSKYHQILTRGGLKSQEGILAPGYSLMYRSLKAFLDG